MHACFLRAICRAGCDGAPSTALVSCYAGQRQHACCHGSPTERRVGCGACARICGHFILCIVMLAKKLWHSVKTCADLSDARLGASVRYLYAMEVRRVDGAAVRETMSTERWSSVWACTPVWQQTACVLRRGNSWVLSEERARLS